jgi:hypothetical protein
VPFLFLGLAAAALYPAGTLAEPGEAWARMVHAYAPAGLIGVLVAGVLAAYMSTVSTEMNWGASYIVNDLYRPVLRPGQTERHYVLVGRIGSLFLFALSMIVAYYFVQGLRAWFLFINSVVFAFILPLSWLRFFWWRLNVYGEAAALVIGLPLSYIVWFPLGFSNEQVHLFWEGFLLLFGLGAVTSVVVSLVTRPEPIETLRGFYDRCRPPGFWGPVVRQFPVAKRAAIRAETARDLVDCALGVVFAAACILAVVTTRTALDDVCGEPGSCSRAADCSSHAGPDAACSTHSAASSRRCRRDRAWRHREPAPADLARRQLVHSPGTECVESPFRRQSRMWRLSTTRSPSSMPCGRSRTPR